MFFRGARIQQDEQARSTFLSPDTLFNVRAELPSAAGVSPVHFALPTPFSGPSPDSRTQLDALQRSRSRCP